MKFMKRMMAVGLLVGAFLISASLAAAAPMETVEKDDRCAVCGMFVAKYPTWITQIRHKDDSVKCFDGVKDMMVYYFNPEKYSAQTKDNFLEIWVKDYYSLKWQDAKSAFYVVGSDVKGPMGPEFIPFSSKGAAETFLKDHQGKKILTFGEITHEQVESMRMGHKMKMHMK